MAFLARATVLLATAALALPPAVLASPWDLRDYDRVCEETRLSRIRSDASGVTYSPVTNTLWVVARKPMGLFEYDIDGDYLRYVEVGNMRFKDPEGITWMYEHRFAVSQERSDNDKPGRRKSQITIFDIKPWERHPRHVRTLLVDDFRQSNNKGLEAITWDPHSEEFIVGQEMDPLASYRVDPRSGRAKQVMRRAERSRELRDFAGMYYRPRDDGAYVLSRGSRSVLKLDEDGRPVPGQESKVVVGRIPEGLTFSSDGALMFVVAEPNHLLVKSSIGTCSWRPDRDILRQYLGDGGSSLNPDSESETPSESPSESDSEEVVYGPLRTEGYCNFNGCKDGAQGSEWCLATIDNCVAGCNGWWCSNIPAVPPINQANYIAPPSPPPPGAPPAPPAPPSPPAPGAPLPWYEQGEENGYCNWDGCNGEEQGQIWCRRSVGNCVACMGTWCAKEPSSDGTDPVDPERYDELYPDTAADTEGSDAGAADLAAQAGEDADEALPNGYQAQVSVMISGRVGGFDDAEQGAMLKVAARATYGSPDADVMLSMAQLGDGRRRALLNGEPMPAALSELTGGKPATVVRLSALGVTADHADNLERSIREAIESGEFARELNVAGLADVGSVAVLGSGVQRAAMPAEDFPRVDNPVEQGDVIVVYLEPEGGNLTLLTGAVIALASVLALLIGGAAVMCCLRRRAACDSACAAPHAASAGGAAGARELKQDVVLQMTPPPARPLRPPRASAKEGAAPGHRRNNSDASSTCGLLTTLDSPLGTPGHSRQTSLFNGADRLAGISDSLVLESPQAGEAAAVRSHEVRVSVEQADQ
eukprot:jgi/Tetstr1/428853/TSEL_018840.t1